MDWGLRSLETNPHSFHCSFTPLAVLGVLHIDLHVRDSGPFTLCL